MSRVEYNHLLLEISQRLDELNKATLVYLTCGGRMESSAQVIPGTLFLFQKLQDQKRLAIDQVGLLKDLVKQVSEWSLRRKVEKFEEKRKEYKELLEQTSRALDESNQLQQLVVVCTERVTLEENERNSQTARILFEKLEGRELFEFGRLEFLKEILSRIQRQDLVKEIQDFEKRRTNEDDFERWKAQAGDIVQVARDTGGRIIGVLNMKTVFGVAAAGITLLTVREILTRWSTYDQLVTCFQGCVLPAGSRLIEVSQGCVCFTIQVDNLTGLTALWNMYEDGTLRERLFNFFVTDEMKTRAGGEENVELTVTIKKEEYEKAYFELVQEADGNQKRPLERGVRRHSDSVLSLPPRTDENSLITITQLKNQVKSLEERIEAVETQMVSFEKGDGLKVKRLENDVRLLKERAESQEEQMTTLSREVFGRRMATEIIPAEEVSVEKPRGIDEHKWNFIKMYVESLQFETKSLMSEEFESGMGTEGAPSEFDVDIGDQRDTQTIAGDDWNSLSSAVQTGNFAIIEDMLSRGLDINTKNNDGNTALILAASTGKIDAVNYLLDKGADPFIVGHFGITPLHAALKDDNVTIIETLMSRGLDVDLKDSGGRTPLMWAAVCGKIEAVNYLLDNGADPCIRDQSGRNSLHAALRGGNVAIIETLMSRGLEIDIKDSEGSTPLMLAAVCGKIEAVNYLLDNGADPCIRDQLGRNSLHTASLSGNVTIIETLMSRGLEIDIKDNRGDTPLMLAAAFDKIEAVNYLLDNGADPCITNQSGRNSLHAASEGGNITIIETLMSRGLDVNSKDNNGRTPLMLFAAFGKIEAVNYLLDKGADPYIRDQSGRNLLHAASTGGNVAIITKMLSLGLDVNSKDIRGHTPLKIAEKFGKTEAVTFLLSKGGH